MAKPEWGTKRWCLSCGAAFYDLDRDPIVCPKCGIDFKPPALAATVTRKAPARRPAPPPAPEKPVEDEEKTGDSEERLKLEGEKQAAGKGDHIEDASELGEDKDDMAEVLEGTVEAKER